MLKCRHFLNWKDNELVRCNCFVSIAASSGCLDGSEELCQLLVVEAVLLEGGNPKNERFRRVL